MRTVLILFVTIFFIVKGGYYAFLQENSTSKHHIFLKTGGMGGYGPVNIHSKIVAYASNKRENKSSIEMNVDYIPTDNIRHLVRMLK